MSRGLLAEVGEAAAFLEHWTRIAGTFVEPWDPVDAMVLRHEDLIEDQERSIERIARLVDTSADGFDSTVFGVRRRGWLERKPTLTATDREALRVERIWEVAETFGYRARD